MMAHSGGFANGMPALGEPIDDGTTPSQNACDALYVAVSCIPKKAVLLPVMKRTRLLHFGSDESRTAATAAFLVEPS